MERVAARYYRRVLLGARLRCMELAWQAYDSGFVACPAAARGFSAALPIGLSEASEAWQARRSGWLAWHLERLRAMVLAARDLSAAAYGR